VDSRLDRNYDMGELNDMSTLAYKCINRLSRKRPSMRDVVQALSRIAKENHSKKRHSRQFLPITIEEGSADNEYLGPQNAISGSEHRREDSMDSLSDLPDV